MAFAANSMFCFSISNAATFSFSFISMNATISLLLRWLISSRLFSLKMSFPVSKISREISHDLSSSVFSIVKSMSNLVRISSSPACAMMASTASVSSASVSSVTSKVMGKFKSWAKARMTLWVNLSMVRMSNAA